MKFSISRPDTTELAVSLYARPLHPELFDTCERYEHQGKHYQASMQLTSVGHVIEFCCGEHFITEVMDSKLAVLPRIKRLCLFSTEQSRSLKYNLDSGHTVRICFECEYMTPEVFRRVEQEYWKDAQSATLSHLTGSKAEHHLPGLSFLRMEPTDEALSVHTFHLYPEEYAIVKTQSLFALTDV